MIPLPWNASAAQVANPLSESLAVHVGLEIGNLSFTEARLSRTFSTIVPTPLGLVRRRMKPVAAQQPKRKHQIPLQCMANVLGLGGRAALESTPTIHSGSLKCEVYAIFATVHLFSRTQRQCFAFIFVWHNRARCTL